MVFDPHSIRQEFPILQQPANDHALVYLDNAATTQKPMFVLERLLGYYQTSNANVHRGSHFLSDQATSQFERARQVVSRFINAPEYGQVIWTKGTTEAINMVAYGIEHLIDPEDEILISSLEHHANLVPWQQLAFRTGARLRVIPFTSDGLWQPEYASYFSERTKIVACTQVSNAIGVPLPVQDVIQHAKRVNAITLIDGAQAVAHYEIDVDQLDCDFYVFSGHKMYGPTGIGVLYGKTDALDSLLPSQTGGEMVLHVTYQATEFNVLPYRLEAGTPNIEGAVGLAAACEYLQKHDRESLLQWEQFLVQSVHALLGNRTDIEIYSPKDTCTLVSLSVKGPHIMDLNGYLDSKGIAVRGGSHCAHPLMAQLGVSGTLRASFACYNTIEEAEYFANTLLDGIEFLSED
ncbi:aminotransferase class V-fold PLP-dependent enzyme [Marinomonas sp. 2405UD68-3]|uniref:aminotransferase class V-fold PLP-dependent enzyme n=1 Tax=Marinomonas sp. 2405UD68-3 TaxID=3391835 RepID=UPI0039C8E260